MFVWGILCTELTQKPPNRTWINLCLPVRRQFSSVVSSRHSPFPLSFSVDFRLLCFVYPCTLPHNPIFSYRSLYMLIQPYMNSKCARVSFWFDVSAWVIPLAEQLCTAEWFCSGGFDWSFRLLDVASVLPEL